MSNNFNLGFPEVTMLTSGISLFATESVNVFFLLFTVATLSSFFRVVLSEKRIEDLKFLVSKKEEPDEQRTIQD